MIISRDDIHLSNNELIFTCCQPQLKGAEKQATKELVELYVLDKQVKIN
jgi:hypothetical protein